MGQQSKFFFSIVWYWKFGDCFQSSKINQIYTKKTNFKIFLIFLTKKKKVVKIFIT